MSKEIALSKLPSESAGSSLSSGNYRAVPDSQDSIGTSIQNELEEKDDNFSLHKATKENNLQMVKYIIGTKGSEYSVFKDTKGEIPLHEACRQGYVDVVKELLGSNSATTDCKRMEQLTAMNYEDHDTPLHIAAKHGHKDVVEVILGFKEGPQVLNKWNRLKNTPVHEAALEGTLGVLELMYAKGTKQVLKLLHEKCEKTPLHSACSTGRLDVVKKIMEWIRTSALGEQKILSAKSKGGIPLYVACKNGHKDVAEHLLSKEETDTETTITIDNKNGDNDLTDQQLKSVNEVHGNTPLHIAARNGHQHVVETILKTGHCQTLLRIKNNAGDTPVHAAASGGHLKVLEVMYDKLNDCIEFKGRRGGTPLHSACGYGHKEVVGKLLIWLKKKSPMKKNADGELPIHMACKYGRGDVVEFLLRREGCIQQLKIGNEVYGNTPLHVAALFGHTVVVEKVLEHEEFKELLQMKNKLRDTPVHSAASTGKLEVLKAMHERDNNCIRFKGRFNGVPLHAACGYGHLDLAKQLLLWESKEKSTLEASSIPVTLPPFISTAETLKGFFDDKDKEKVTDTIDTRSDKEEDEEQSYYTPLTRACQFGRTEVVKLLLDNGAKPYPQALKRAIEGSYEECAKLLLFHSQGGQWKKLLHFAYTKDQNSTTLFCELIKHMPDLADAVLHKCVKLKRFLANATNFEVKLKYEFVDDYKEHTKSEDVEPDESHDEANLHTKICFNKNNHPLALMVKHKREMLLTHPVVAALIHDKWRIYGIFGLLQWLIYLFHITFITALAFALPHPSSSTCMNAKSLAGNINNISSGDILTPNSTIYCQGRINHGLKTYSSVVFTYSILRLLFEGWQFVNSTYSARCEGNVWWKILLVIKRMDYIRQWENWVEIPLFVLSLIFVGGVFNPNYCYCPYDWQWITGVIAVWLSWIEFIILSTQFKIVGVYVLMFIRVSKTFFKFSPLALLLILTFGLTFYFLLYQPDFPGSPYQSPGYSLLKAVSMTAGDVDADTFFGFSVERNITSHPLPYRQLATFLWFASLILMTILLSNLLVGLAVGDIQTIYAKANFEKLAQQVDHVLTVENQLPRCLKEQVWTKQQKQFKPYDEPKWEKIKKTAVYLLWGGVHYDSQESIRRLLPPKSDPAYDAKEVAKEVANVFKAATEELHLQIHLYDELLKKRKQAHATAK